MAIAAIIGSVIIGVLVLGWIGLQIKPKPFESFSGTSSSITQVPLPSHLPVPVERFYRELYGDTIPLIDSAVISGRATMRVNGITFPARYRFVHLTGQAYRHYIEATLFGLPIMKVSEHYLDGNARMELPFGVTENEPKVNQGANLALWAEAMWFPSIFLTDPRVQWEAIDESTAAMKVPFEDEMETFLLRFDPDTGLLDSMQSMRYKGADSEKKTLWINQALEWDTIDGSKIPSVGAVTWFDEGSPWAVFRVESLILNADVNEFIRADGP